MFQNAYLIKINWIISPLFRLIFIFIILIFIIPFKIQNSCIFICETLDVCIHVLVNGVTCF